MKTSNGRFTPSLITAILAAGIPLGIVWALAPANAATPYHCIALVDNTTSPLPSTLHGKNPLNGGVNSQLMGSLATLNGSPVPVLISNVPLTGHGGAGAICHWDAVALFKNQDNTATYGANGVHNTHAGNLVWSDPNQLCARPGYRDKKLHTVGVYEIITEVGGPVTGHVGGFNLVAGYSVTCNGPNTPTQLAVPAVVPQLP
jgi:hypothetical protein